MLRNRATQTRHVAGTFAHNPGTETHMPRYIGPINVDAQYQAFGERRGIIAMGLPNTALFGVWSGTEWLAYDLFSWAFLERRPHFRSGHVDIQLMQIPHLIFVSGPRKGTLIDSYTCSSQMIEAAFRAESLAKLVQPDEQVRRMADQLVNA